MGSCQSTPNHAGSVVTPTAAVGKSHVQKTATQGTQVPLKTTNTTANSNHDTTNYHEETDTTSDGSDRENNRPRVTTTVAEGTNANPLVSQQQHHRVSKYGGDQHSKGQRKRMKPGYSSGGSSEYSDETETHKHLLDWKNELGADGDLCKGVVHIETDFGRPIEEVYEGVHDGPVLGSGVEGVVRRVVHKKTGVNYAVKCLDVGLIQTESGLKALREEIFIMCQLDHPNIVRLEEVYESENEIYLIQELCLGGDLFDRLDEQSDFHYTEAACARLVKQILSSVRYLHSKNIIHRDLKLENFLFSSADADSELRMIDFGLSKHFKYDGEIQHECVGTPYTVAPEVIRAKYDEKVDIWSIGVISFLLLCGETPFGGAEEGENLNYVRQNILRGEVKFEPKDLWEHVSDSGKAFVKRLLNPDPTQRPMAKECQTDTWLLTYGKRDSAEGHKVLSPKLAQSLVEFKEYSDMRKVLCEVLSFTLLPEQIADLRKEFELVDTDGDGEISLCALRQVLMQNAEAGTLGALTEVEVSDVFNALRVRKSETKIRWHEFIAAGLSQCNFDERNLKLAFDRLDYDRKGYITFNDMKELLGTSQGDEDGHIEQMGRWYRGVFVPNGPVHVRRLPDVH
jgi:calcium-dependent protein kinase